MVGELILKSVVENTGHWTPHIAGADGEIGNRDGLGLLVVDAGSREGVTFEGAR